MMYLRFIHVLLAWWMSIAWESGRNRRDMNNARTASAPAAASNPRSCRRGSTHETGDRPARADIRGPACGREKSMQDPARAAREFRQTPEYSQRRLRLELASYASSRRFPANADIGE